VAGFFSRIFQTSSLREGNDEPFWKEKLLHLHVAVFSQQLSPEKITYLAILCDLFGMGK